MFVLYHLSHMRMVALRFVLRLLQIWNQTILTILAIGKCTLMSAYAVMDGMNKSQDGLTCNHRRVGSKILMNPILLQLIIILEEECLK